MRFATRICDFFVAHYSAEWGFGKLWSMQGEALDTTGSVGGFILNALIDTWRVTKRQEYLKTAAHGAGFLHGARCEPFSMHGRGLSTVRPWTRKPPFPLWSQRWTCMKSPG